MKKMWSLMAIGLLAVGGTACGSDDENDTDTTTGGDTEETVAGDGDTSSDNADVVEYCEQADAFAAAWQEFMDDPTSGDIAELNEEGAALVARGTELSTANADDAEAIAACNQKVSEAMTP